MDHMGQCSNALLVEHIVLAFFAMVTTCFTAFLVHRRIRADRERRSMKCPECLELDQKVTARHRRGNTRGYRDVD